MSVLFISSIHLCPFCQPLSVFLSSSFSGPIYLSLSASLYLWSHLPVPLCLFFSNWPSCLYARVNIPIFRFLAIHGLNLKTLLDSMSPATLKGVVITFFKLQIYFYLTSTLNSQSWISGSYENMSQPPIWTHTYKHVCIFIPMVNLPPYRCIHLHVHTYTHTFTPAYPCVHTYAHIEPSLYTTINSVTFVPFLLQFVLVDWWIHVNGISTCLGLFYS